MNDRSSVHDTMVLERVYPVDAGRVFSAWADSQAKRIWFARGADEAEYSLDFRVGGRELFQAGAPDGDFYTYDAYYQNVVPDQRIVYTNRMLRNDVPLSVSLTSVEFTPVPDGTRLILTEHGIYLDGQDKPEYRAEGINAQLDALGRLLGVPAETA
jgi:uncharacterized protein YndB with AHSA1/START domain